MEISGKDGYDILMPEKIYERLSVEKKPEEKKVGDFILNLKVKYLLLIGITITVVIAMYSILL